MKIMHICFVCFIFSATSLRLNQSDWLFIFFSNISTLFSWKSTEISVKPFQTTSTIGPRNRSIIVRTSQSQMIRHQISRFITILNCTASKLLAQIFSFSINQRKQLTFCFSYSFLVLQRLCFLKQEKKVSMTTLTSIICEQWVKSIVFLFFSFSSVQCFASWQSSINLFIHHLFFEIHLSYCFWVWNTFLRFLPVLMSFSRFFFSMPHSSLLFLSRCVKTKWNISLQFFKKTQDFVETHRKDLSAVVIYSVT